MSGISLDVTSESWATDDKSWLKHQYGFDTARPCTLDLTLFNATDHLVNGAIPSGICIAKVTASGLYGPYDPDGVDGREVGVGVLLNGARMTRDDGAALTVQGSAFLWQAIIDETKLLAILVGGNSEGVPDAGFKTDVPGLRWE